MGGQLYRQPTLDIVSQEHYKKDFHRLSAQEQEDAHEKASEQWKATLFLVNSNPKKYDQLRKELHNEQIAGNDNYPKTRNAAFTRFNQHKPYGSSAPLFSNEGHTFATTNSKSSRNKMIATMNSPTMERSNLHQSTTVIGTAPCVARKATHQVPDIVG